MAQGTWPQDVIAAAVASGRKWDIPASVSLAQWALESAWGSAMPPGSNNPFGIKATPSQVGVITGTHEDNGTHLVATKARFRVFGSIAEAFDQHGALLATAAPYAAARKVRHDANAFADALTGVYATDHLYGAKLRSIMISNSLYGYDTDAPMLAQPTPAPPSVATAAPPPAPTTMPPKLSWLQKLVVLFTYRKAA